MNKAEHMIREKFTVRGAGSKSLAEKLLQLAAKQAKPLDKLIVELFGAHPEVYFCNFNYCDITNRLKNGGKIVLPHRIRVYGIKKIIIVIDLVEEDKNKMIEHAIIQFLYSNGIEDVQCVYFRLGYKEALLSDVSFISISDMALIG